MSAQVNSCLSAVDRPAPCLPCVFEREGGLPLLSLLLLLLLVVVVMSHAIVGTHLPRLI
jgi:hypothetical protein